MGPLPQAFQSGGLRRPVGYHVCRKVRRSPSWFSRPCGEERGMESVFYACPSHFTGTLAWVAPVANFFLSFFALRWALCRIRWHFCGNRLSPSRRSCPPCHRSICNLVQFLSINSASQSAATPDFPFVRIPFSETNLSPRVNTAVAPSYDAALGHCVTAHHIPRGSRCIKAAVLDMR